MAKTKNSTKTNDTTAFSDAPPFFKNRRAFLTSLAAGASVAAVAVIPKAIAAPLDDSALVKLEEQIFEQYEGACAFDAEIIRLSDIWTAKSHRLYEEALSSEVQAGTYLTAQEQMGTGY